MNLLRLRLGHNEIDPRFIHCYFLSGQFRSAVRQNVGHAVNQVSINQKNLSIISVLVAPLAEQKRIVAQVETLLARVQAARQRLARVPTLLKRFRQAILAAACNGRLTADWRESHVLAKSVNDVLAKISTRATSLKTRRGVPEQVPISETVADWDVPVSWTIASTANLLRMGGLEDVKDGNHGANHPKVSEFTDVGMPFVTAAQVNDYRIDYENAYKVSGKALDRLRVGFAKSGDVIYTHKGSVGRVAVAD